MVVVDPELCTGCETCTTVCSVEAVALNPESGKARIDTDVCIECYSCMNICPEGAISEKE